jgi:hypothetical protein
MMQLKRLRKVLFHAAPTDYIDGDEIIFGVIYESCLTSGIVC